MIEKFRIVDRQRSRVPEKPVSSDIRKISAPPVQTQTSDELLRTTVKQIETVLGRELLNREDFFLDEYPGDRRSRPSAISGRFVTPQPPSPASF